MHDTYTQDYLAQGRTTHGLGLRSLRRADRRGPRASADLLLTFQAGSSKVKIGTFEIGWHLMNSSVISAVAALGGAVIGGLTSIAASWMTQQLRVRAKQLAQHKQRRIKLYNEFIEEASKLFVDALEHETPNPSAMVGLYTTISRMRILSSAAVIECAEKVGDVIVDTYLAPKMTPDELRETLKSRTFHSFDYLRDFSKVCRAERGTDLPQQI
jgi:hypothetical protein